MATKTSDVIIIGGGIIGCALAESLARERLDVTLIERGIIGREASWAAAGMLAPQSEMPEDGPYARFCLAARKMYPEVVDRIRASSAIDPQYRDEGMFYIAHDEAQEGALRERAEWQREAGYEVEILSAQEARSIEPALEPEFRSAVHFKEDHQIDPRLMTRGFAIAARRLGARLVEYSPVIGLLTDGDRVTGVETAGERIHADRVVLAGGCWSGLLAGLAEPVPTYPVKGQVLMLQCDAPRFAHTLHGEGVYLVPRLDGRVIIGATEEHEAGFDKTVQAGALTGLLGDAYGLAPCLREARFVEAWAGLRPGTPDRLPIFGPSKLDGLVYATGHFRNGVLLAPITAKLLTEFIIGGRLPDALEPFRAERFASAPSRATPISS